MNPEPTKPIQKSDLVGRRIVRILTRDGEYDGYPTNEAGFVLDDGFAFSLSGIECGVYEFEAESDHYECQVEEILGKQIRALCYIARPDGYARSDSVFLDLMDGPCVSHRCLAPEGIYVGIMMCHRSQIAEEGERVCDYFDEPPVPRD